MHTKLGWLIPVRIITKIFLCNILFIEKWLSGNIKWNEISYHDNKITNYQCLSKILTFVNTVNTEISCYNFRSQHIYSCTNSRKTIIALTFLHKQQLDVGTCN